MRFTAATVLALVGAAFAQTSGFDAMSKPTEGEEVTAGSTYDITWSYNSEFPGTVTLELMGGASSSTLNILNSIASMFPVSPNRTKAVPMLTRA